MARGTTTDESGHLVAIATQRHGAPAAATRAGVIVEEEATGGIGAAANRCARTFNEEFGSGASRSGEKPVQTTFPGDELQRPSALAGDQFVMAFGDAQDFVN